MKKVFLLVCCCCVLMLSGCTNTITQEEKLMKFTLDKPTQEAYDAKLEEAISKADGQKAIITVPQGTYIFNESHKIPENITLGMLNGVQFNVAAEKELEITGTVEAGPYQIFTGEGKITGHIQGEGYVQWFGADKMSEDATEAFQKAVDACATVLVPDRTNGYNIQSIQMTKPVILKGIGASRVTINVLEGRATNCLGIVSSNVSVENFKINCNINEPASELAIYINTSKGNLKDIAVKNVHIFNPGYGIGDSGSKKYTAENVTLQDINIDSNRNTGIHFENLTKGINLKDVVISSFAGGTEAKGYIFENIHEMYLENIDVLGGGAKDGTGGDGMTFINCQNVSCYRVMIDYVNGKQLVIKNSSNFKLSNFVCSLVKVDAFYFENFKDSTLDVIKANGVYTTSENIVSLIGCSGLVFNDFIVQDSQSNGIYLKNSTNNTFNSTVMINLKGQAVVEEGSCSNTYNGLVCVQNGGGIKLTGSSKVNGYVSNSGQASTLINAPYSD